MDASELLLSPIAHMAPSRILSGLSPAQAASHLQGAPHSVVEILAHMLYWQSWFLERCAGTATPLPASAAAGDWEPSRQRFLDGLDRAAEIGEHESAFARRVDPPIEFPPLANYTIADAITHMAIHNAHHLGQIVTLRQILGAWPPPEGSYTW